MLTTSPTTVLPATGTASSDPNPLNVTEGGGAAAGIVVVLVAGTVVIPVGAMALVTV